MRTEGVVARWVVGSVVHQEAIINRWWIAAGILFGIGGALPSINIRTDCRRMFGVEKPTSAAYAVSFVVGCDFLCGV
jgi:hypothetical protein